MIVVDTSALMSIILRGDRHEQARIALRMADGAIMSAGTLTETIIVSERRGVHRLVLRLIQRRPIEVIPLDADSARFAGEVYSVWGKGVHPAGLNFGDCFAYALAKSRDLPLLYVGDDFARTDIRAALPAATG